MTRHVVLLLVLSGCSHYTSFPNGCEPMSGESIRESFADVVDTAVIQDADGGRATNHWYADGTFTSDWETPEASGRLNGTWHIEDNLRCVVVEGGFPDGGSNKRCGPLYQCSGSIVSINANGEPHGLHTLQPL